MSYRPIGNRKILESLFEVYCSFKANNQEEITKELAHLNVKLQEAFDQRNSKSCSAGYLAAQSFFIGREYQKSHTQTEIKKITMQTYTVQRVLTRLESELSEIQSLVNFLKKQDPETMISSLIDEDVKEGIWEFLGEA